MGCLKEDKTMARKMMETEKEMQLKGEDKRMSENN